MPERDMTHLDDHDLLLFLDGEAGKARTAAIDRHLAACWRCRARRDELQATITTVVRAMDEVVLPSMPPPPGPWEGLEPHLARLDERLDAERRVGRFARWRGVAAAMTRAPRGRWVAAAALVAIVAAIAVLQQRTVTASELLAKARPVERVTAHRRVTLEQRHHATGRLIARRHIEVWQRATGERARRLYDDGHRLLAGEWTHGDGSRILYRRGQAAARERSGDPLPAGGGLDELWRLDLSAATFAALIAMPEHATVDRRSDAFVVSWSLAPIAGPDGEGAPAAAGPTAVRLVLNKTDLHPLEQSLTFGSGADAFTFRFVENDFTELPAAEIPIAALTPDRDLEAAANAALPAAPMPNAAATPPASRRGLTPGETLGLRIDALIRLDGVGALLGEQVTVAATTDGHVAIEALVDTAARKAEIIRALDSLAPRWAIRQDIATFDDARRRTPARQTGSPSPVVRSVEITARRALVYDDLKRFFAERLAREAPAVDAAGRLDRDIQDFTGQVLEHSLQARLHARALTQLLSLVTSADLRTLAPERARAWRTRVRDHAGALRRETAALRHAIEPIFFPAAADSDSAPITDLDLDLDAWRAASRLFELTSAHDVTIGQAFALSALDTTPAHVKSREFRHSLISAEALAERLQGAMATPRPPAP